MAKTKTMVSVFGFSFPFLSVSNLVVRIARPTSLAIWHRGRSHRRPNRSGSPNRRHFASLGLNRGLSEYCLECPLSIGSSTQRHRIWRVLQCFASATLLLGWGLFWRAFSLGVSPLACSWDYMTWKGFWEKCVHYPTCSSNSAWKAEQHHFCGVCWSFHITLSYHEMCWYSLYAAQIVSRTFWSPMAITSESPIFLALTEQPKIPATQQNCQTKNQHLRRQ